jgi:hypothetical protein
MIIPLRFLHLGWAVLLLNTLLVPVRGHAQSTCMLLPVPLAQRVQGATLVVEARVNSQQAEHRATGRHIVTRSQLQVFKVFKGQLPIGPLSVLTAGGTLGLEREITTGTLQLTAGAQGVFFLEPDPAAPSEWRAYAGPQGFIVYNLADATAAEPFGNYPTILAALYPALSGSGGGSSYRTVQPNAALATALARKASPKSAASVSTLGVTATPVISGFTPTTVTAGTSTSATNATVTLTINGTGFNSVQGTGYVEFRSADSPGGSNNPNYTRPLASDYVTWTDTQIKVRVPSCSTTGEAAGTGLVRVTNSDGNLATSSSVLTVTYAVLNTTYPNASNVDQTYRIRMVGTDGLGGYTLHYSPSFLAEAKTPYETALRAWHCATSMNRTLGSATTLDVASEDGTNVVRFGSASELPTGVLGVTDSYYGGCGNSTGGIVNWWLIETDYTFAPIPCPGLTWNFTTSAPSMSQVDFQSVALHELGHGQQLGHIISATGVMNFSIGNGETKRTLDASIDIAGANDIITFSTGATLAQRCSQPAFTTSSANCTLPVELVAFEAAYTPGQGTDLSWATASEKNSAAFVVESKEASNTDIWQDVARVAALGNSTAAHTYAALDSRPLSGTRYYRLRQLDYDGTVVYSPARAVQGAELATLAAYPNPATGTVQLRGPLASGATAQVRLLDATGRCVMQQAGPAGQAAFSLPLAGVQAGLYLIEWLNGPTPYRSRLVVE